MFWGRWPEGRTASAEAPKWDGTCLFRELKRAHCGWGRGVKRAVAEKVREVMRAGWVGQARERNLGLSEGKRDPGSLGRG